MKLTRIYRENDIVTLIKTDRGWLPLGGDIDSQALERGQALLNHIEDYEDADFILSLDNYKAAPLLSSAKNIICIGLNYQDHIAETSLAKTDFPEIFTKTTRALNSHEAPIVMSPYAKKYDYEGELVIIIGKEAKYVSEENADDYILGYTIGNDFSARDLQFRGSQWILGKTLDGFAPIGPSLVTADDFDFDNARITTKVNGQIRQEASLQQMIFKPAQIISYLSQFMTLQEGDIIFTGTPSGVILGDNESKWQWLKDGDQISISITGIGQLDNILKSE